ncbi:MAG TPA: histidine phosphatase family protein [Thermosynechococcaceae cyanobacterium]
MASVLLIEPLPPSLKTEDTVLTTRVILVRHGESSYNVERRVQGHCDQSTLTAAGEAGARKVAAALSDLRFDAVYSSPLKRARRTAELVLEGLKLPPTSPLQFSDNLKEINLVTWEGRLFSEIEQNEPEGDRAWKNAPHTLCMTVEGVDYYPVPALYEQAETFWKETLPLHTGQKNQTILLVAHSGIIRALIGTAIGLGCDRYQAFYQSNCGLNVLNFVDNLGDPVQIESLNQTAHLNEPLPKPVRGNQGRRFLLVRHGETEWNRQKRFQGQIDVPLNENGRLQAEQAAEFLREVAIDQAVTSPLLRPKETAEIILQRHPDVRLEFNANLVEISHGLWEGKLEEEIEQEFSGELERWQTSPETVQMPEGENLQQVWDRSVAAWNAIVQSARDRPPSGITLVVAHDAVNKALLCYLAGLSPRSFWSFKQGNGAVSVIDYPQGLDKPPVLQASNITTHLAGGVLDKTAAGAL